MAEAAYRPRPARVVIIGAGLAGISTGIALKRQLGFENFTIYEKASTIGGTWRDNTYPGCGSDIPGHWYSLSTELNPNWSSYYVSQPEIRAYWEELYLKHDLPTHTVLSTAVVSAEWDSTFQLYKVVLQNTETGEQSTTDAEIIIWAIGGFMAPAFPKDVPGAERFAGEVWHSAQWRHDVDLAGKRVGVIGNGCSAAQFIPQISKDPTVQLTNFCRTPQWFVPRLQYEYPAWAKWIFANIPFAMRTYRNYVMAKSDIGFITFRKTHTRLLKFVRSQLTKYIRHKAPKEQYGKLIPNYAPGCKRIIVDPGYLSSLSRPNVHLTWDAIDGIVEEGIKLKSGEVVPLDVIIFGTGFSIESSNISIYGRKGVTLMEYFASQGGPTAYLGTCMPGFPNFFTLTGPNTATGHASLIFSDEVQIQYTLQLIKPVIQGTARSFEVRPQATDEYNTWLQRRLSQSVWMDCQSYYRTGNQKGKNIATFPGPLTLFWWLARKPRWDHFEAAGGERWERQRKLARAKVWVLMGLLLAVLTSVGPSTTSISDIWSRVIPWARVIRA